MKYLKPSLSYEQQADRLIERGLVAEKASLVDILSNISYYHFSAYLFPFKQDNSDCLKPGTSLDQIYRRYRFDRRLRCLIMDALERVETALKAKVVTVFTQKYGPFGYLDKANYNNFCDADFQKLMATIDAEVNRHIKSKEQFVTHYLDKYDEPNLPFWMVAELLTFGNILTIYRKMHRPIQQEIASEFGVPVVIMESSSWHSPANSNSEKASGMGENFKRQAICCFDDIEPDAKEVRSENRMANTHRNADG